MNAELTTADLSSADRDVRFQKAVDSILNFEPRAREGIGMQKEKSLHAILKNYEDPDPSHQEVPVKGYIADICDQAQGKIVEVQSANMGNLRGKLAAFLPDYQVTIVYPIPHRKTVTWIDPETGELLASNKSHFIGSFYEVFRELYKIDSFLSDPNLAIAPILIDMTEYRIQDGWSRDGKRGSHRFDRVPDRIYDELRLEKAEDYAVFLPSALSGNARAAAGRDCSIAGRGGAEIGMEDLLRRKGLPDGFTAKDFESVVGIHRKSISYSTILRILTELGVTERIGMTSRRAYRYRVMIENETGKDFCRR